LHRNIVITSPILRNISLPQNIFIFTRAAAHGTERYRM
jgi:hypothetical protein